jgi:hypothetical protein
MSRPILQQRLNEALRLVHEGQRHIVRQEDLIARLDRGGRSIANAKRLLTNLRAAQSAHEHDVERLLNELG